MGRKPDITLMKKQRIADLLEHSSLKQYEIAKIVGTSKYVVSRIKKLLQNGEFVTPPHRGNCRKQKKTSEREDRTILKLTLQNRKRSTAAINDIIKKNDINISNRTLRRRFKQLGLKQCRPTIKQKLTPNMITKRIAWGRKYKHFSVSDWSNVRKNSYLLFRFYQFS